MTEPDSSEADEPAALANGEAPASTGVPIVLQPSGPDLDPAPAAWQSYQRGDTSQDYALADPDAWESYLQPDSPTRRESGPEYWEASYRDREAATTENADMRETLDHSYLEDQDLYQGEDSENESVQAAPLDETGAVESRRTVNPTPDRSPATAGADDPLFAAPMTVGQSRAAAPDLSVSPLARWERDHTAAQGEETAPVNDLDLSPLERWERDWEDGDRDDAAHPLIATFLDDDEDEEQSQRDAEDRSRRDLEDLQEWFDRSREQDQSPVSFTAAPGDATGPPGPDLTESQAESERRSPADEALEQVATELDARDKQRLDDLGIHSDQEKVQRLEELEDRASAVGASGLAEAVRDTRRQDPEIIVASEISDLQEAVVVAEEMAPESETQGPGHGEQGKEPPPDEGEYQTGTADLTLVDRIRQCVGDEVPTKEKLVEVYVNADAEERAYLDSLGVGDLAARHGHRVATEDATLVEDALDDGWVTDEEASAAGRVQNLAEQETPDPIIPSYTMTQEEFEERVRELCDDPDALATFGEQVEAQAAAAKRERRFKAKQLREDPAAAAQDVSDDLRSEAGEMLGQRARQAASGRAGLLDGLQGEERDEAREELEEAGVLTPRKRTWTAKQLKKQARELCPPAARSGRPVRPGARRCPSRRNRPARRHPRARGVRRNQRSRQVCGDDR